MTKQRSGLTLEEHRGVSKQLKETHHLAAEIKSKIKSAYKPNIHFELFSYSGAILDHISGLADQLQHEICQELHDDRIKEKEIKNLYSLDED